MSGRDWLHLWVAALVVQTCVVMCALIQWWIAALLVSQAAILVVILGVAALAPRPTTWEPTTKPRPKA